MATLDSDNNSKKTDAENPAANLIRSKIDAIYGNEPNAKIEIEEVEQEKSKLSKHQQYMKKLSESGRSLAEIQTDWHKYYQGLPDAEKHEVWQEFYDTNKKLKEHPAVPAAIEHIEQKTHGEVDDAQIHNVASIKKRIHKKAHYHSKTKLSAKSHFKSLLFGVSMGMLALLILLFSFFNERFIAPFITPSKTVSSTSIVIDPNSSSVGPGTEVVIPKINVEVPVVYDVASLDEKAIQKGLESGVVHYATTPSPGEKGNIVIVGHSSNNILNSGQYKFAFVLLNKLAEGDTFSLTKNGKRYVYKIYEKRIVKPTDVSVLGAADKPATATLITCDPPGTSINRLVVTGEQISPDPTANTASTALASAGAQPTIVPGNAPSLWSRLKNWITG